MSTPTRSPVYVYTTTTNPSNNPFFSSEYNHNSIVNYLQGVTEEESLSYSVFRYYGPVGFFSILTICLLVYAAIFQAVSIRAGHHAAWISSRLALTDMQIMRHKRQKKMKAQKRTTSNDDDDSLSSPLLDLKEEPILDRHFLDNQNSFTDYTLFISKHFTFAESAVQTFSLILFVFLWLGQGFITEEPVFYAWDVIRLSVIWVLAFYIADGIWFTYQFISQQQQLAQQQQQQQQHITPPHTSSSSSSSSITVHSVCHEYLMYRFFRSLLCPELVELSHEEKGEGDKDFEIAQQNVRLFQPVDEHNTPQAFCHVMQPREYMYVIFHHVICAWGLLGFSSIPRVPFTLALFYAGIPVFLLNWSWFDRHRKLPPAFLCYENTIQQSYAEKEFMHLWRNTGFEGWIRKGYGWIPSLPATWIQTWEEWNSFANEEARHERLAGLIAITYWIRVLVFFGLIFVNRWFQFPILSLITLCVFFQVVYHNLISAILLTEKPFPDLFAKIAGLKEWIQETCKHITIRA